MTDFLITAPLHEEKIELTHSTAGSYELWCAHRESNYETGPWACGKTQEEAIANLLELERR